MTTELLDPVAVRPWRTWRHSRRYEPMAHLAGFSGLLCGYHSFDGWELDGAWKDYGDLPGYAYHACDDCAWEALGLELDDEEAQARFEDLPDHFVEEILR